MNPVMRRLLGTIAVALLIGLGWFAWWTLSPLFITRTVSESLTTPSSSNSEIASEADILILRSGNFEGADALHQVSGQALIVDRGTDTIIRFEEDFRSTNGPDLYVWLVQGEDNSSYLDLGRLKGNEGSQNYPIPEDADLSQYDRVIIWCRAFSVLFGSAPLN